MIQVILRLLTVHIFRNLMITRLIEVRHCELGVVSRKRPEEYNKAISLYSVLIGAGYNGFQRLIRKRRLQQYREGRGARVCKRGQG